MVNFQSLEKKCMSAVFICRNAIDIQIQMHYTLYWLWVVSNSAVTYQCSYSCDWSCCDLLVYAVVFGLCLLTDISVIVHLLIHLLFEPLLSIPTYFMKNEFYLGMLSLLASYCYVYR